MSRKSVIALSLLIFLLLIIFFIPKAIRERSVGINSLNTKNIMTLEIKSSGFQNGQVIPVKYTCDGGNIVPSIQVSNVSEDAKSLALVIEDPDAPSGTWDHLVMWNIPAENFRTEEGKLPVGIIGKGSGGNQNYQGPCPPKGPGHRYFFKVFALDSLLDLKAGSNKNDLLKAIEGHIVGQGEMYGTYSRN